ncbi:MAG: T9SS type A sorting domain-containing protein [Prevotella sp.]|nr:T9SS type A sorting domain-containing protein [Prevotella sp.]
MAAMEQAMDEEVSITVSGQWVTISGAQGQTLEVVSLTGRSVMTVKIESPAQRIELNVPKGCYILKVGKMVRKVAIG